MSHHNALIAKTQYARRDLGLTDDEFRDALYSATGKTSRKDCTEAELVRFIDQLAELGWRPANGRATKPSHRPYVRLIFGLWSELASLGALDDGSRKALIAFIKRQTGVAAPDWLAPAQANKVIEALKAWLARTNGARHG